MAAAASGPSWNARARFCHRRTRRSLAPDPASAVKSLLIGGSETGAGWPRQNGRLLALLGPALARLRALSRLTAWGARPGLAVTVSLMAREMCAPRQRTWTLGASADRAPTPSASLLSHLPGCGPSSQFTDAETEAKHKLHQCLAIREPGTQKSSFHSCLQTGSLELPASLFLIGARYLKDGGSQWGGRGTCKTARRGLAPWLWSSIK